MIVNFLSTEFHIPDDIFIYIEISKLSDKIQQSLFQKFQDLLIQKKENGIIDDGDLIPAMKEEISIFITKLCENGIYNKTADDYVFQNEGYQKYQKVNHDAYEAILETLNKQMEDMREGAERAERWVLNDMPNARSHVITNDLVTSLAVSAAGYLSEKNQIEKAEKKYKEYLSTISDAAEQKQKKSQEEYIEKIYIPKMYKALMEFSYYAAHQYLVDLYHNGLFEWLTFEYTKLDESNKILNKLPFYCDDEEVMLEEDILKEAFISCPYNAEIYIKAAEIGFWGEDEQNTAKIFEVYNIVSSRLMTCPYCSHENIDIAQKICPFCGENIKDYFDNQKLNNLRNERESLLKINQEKRMEEMYEALRKYDSEQKELREEKLGKIELPSKPFFWSHIFYYVMNKLGVASIIMGIFWIISGANVLICLLPSILLGEWEKIINGEWLLKDEPTYKHGEFYYEKDIVIVFILIIFLTISSIFIISGIIGWVEEFSLYKKVKKDPIAYKEKILRIQMDEERDEIKERIDKKYDKIRDEIITEYAKRQKEIKEA